MADHEWLIEKLGRSAEPVKRPWRSGWRVASWLAVALPCGVAVSLMLHRAQTDWSHAGAPWAMLQLLLSLVLILIFFSYNLFPPFCVTGRIDAGLKTLSKF